MTLATETLPKLTESAEWTALLENMEREGRDAVALRLKSVAGDPQHSRFRRQDFAVQVIFNVLHELGHGQLVVRVLDLMLQKLEQHHFESDGASVGLLGQLPGIRLLGHDGLSGQIAEDSTEADSPQAPEAAE